MEAVKHDGEKPRLGLVPPKAVFEIGKAMTYGSKKYEDYNYKKGGGLDWNRYYDALLRHVNAWLDGEEYDKESGLRHTSHAGACMVMLIDAVESGIGKDTRFKEKLTGHRKPGWPFTDEALMNGDFIRMPAKYGLPILDRSKMTCTYKGIHYDARCSQMFPKAVIRAFRRTGVLTGKENTWANSRKPTPLSVDGLIGNAAFLDDDVRYMDGIAERVERYHHKYAVKYKGKAYNIKSGKMFPRAVLKWFLDHGMIAGNTRFIRAVSGKKYRMSRIAADIKSPPEAEFYKTDTMIYAGHEYDLNMPGWMPTGAIIRAYDLGLIGEHENLWNGPYKDVSGATCYSVAYAKYLYETDHRTCPHRFYLHARTSRPSVFHVSSPKPAGGFYGRFTKDAD